MRSASCAQPARESCQEHEGESNITLNRTVYSRADAAVNVRLRWQFCSEMMKETIRFGNLQEIGLEVVERQGRLFVRYDAGAHQVAWREDEIGDMEFEGIAGAKDRRNETMFAIQKRLEGSGTDPYRSNWTPRWMEQNRQVQPIAGKPGSG